MSRRARWMFGVAALLALAVAAALWLRPARGPGADTSGNGASGPAGGPGAAAPAASAAVPTIEIAATDLATASAVELVQSLTVSGSLKAAQSAFVKARVGAEIRELTVREGDRVVAGQLIGRLDSTEFDWRLRQAEDQARSAEAQLEIAERTLANNRALVDQGFISKNALDTAISNETGARAALQAARAAAELSRKAVRDAEIRAPIGGLVAQRLAQPGERVSLDTRIVEIVDLTRVELEAAVTPEDVLAVRIGQTARVALEGMAEPLGARVTRINPSTQAGTRAVMTYLELAPHPALRQGLFARATIDLKRRTALVVPASAVRFDRARPYVLALADGMAVERPVTLGQRGEAPIDGRPEAAIEITEGLAAGTEVLRGSVGSVRGGTRILRSGAGVAAAAGPASGAASGAAMSAASPPPAGAARP
jgi:membrane fusion protein (multidrug efflux system)